MIGITYGEITSEVCAEGLGLLGKENPLFATNVEEQDYKTECRIKDTIDILTLVMKTNIVWVCSYMQNYLGHEAINPKSLLAFVQEVKLHLVTLLQFAKAF